MVTNTWYFLKGRDYSFLLTIGEIWRPAPETKAQKGPWFLLWLLSWILGSEMRKLLPPKEKANDQEMVPAVNRYQNEPSWKTPLGLSHASRWPRSQLSPWFITSGEATQWTWSSFLTHTNGEITFVYNNESQNLSLILLPELVLSIFYMDASDALWNNALCPCLH